MKSASLLGLRVATGLLLIVWGLVKVAAPAAAIHVSDKFYHGMLSVQSTQMPLGIAEVILGAAVVLGLWRVVVLPLQAIVLGVGFLAIWKYVIDPFGMYLVPSSQREILFFPSLTVFAAALVQIAFRDSDRFAFDKFFVRSMRDQMRDHG